MDLGQSCGEQSGESRRAGRVGRPGKLPPPVVEGWRAWRRPAQLDESSLLVSGEAFISGKTVVGYRLRMQRDRCLLDLNVPVPVAQDDRVAVQQHRKQLGQNGRQRIPRGSAHRSSTKL